jgi:hypothetical protein
MKLTNRHHLPDPIVQAILADDYDKGEGDFSVTELLKPPQIAHLERIHGDELESDVVDNIWSLFGRAVHLMLARQDREATTEKRLYITRDGSKIGGQFDRFVFEQGGIEDYKVTSVWHFKNVGPGSEWECQQNLYAHILRANGYDPKYLRINAFLRDWNVHEAKRIDNYPQKQFATVDLPLWSSEKAEALLMERLKLHKENPPQPCSPEDRWYRPGVWAVMKSGRKSAVKLLPTEGEANALIAQQKDSSKHYTQFRPGSYIRCESYCPASTFCKQWADDPENPTNILKGF